MKTILIAGSSGLVGRELIRFFSGETRVIAVTRSKKTFNEGNVTNVVWDFSNIDQLIPYLNECDVVINLVGENLGKQLWTTSFKEKLISSRVNSAEKILTAISKSGNNKLQYIQASAVGYYGYDHLETKTEDSPAGNGFLAGLCKIWESNSVTVSNKKTYLRFGIILSDKASIIKKTYLPFKFGLGAILGNGKNSISWVHIDDVVLSIKYCIENEVSGPVNIVADSVTSSSFYKTYANVLKRKVFFKVPSFVLNIVGKTMKNEFLLANYAVKSKKLIDHGYKFKYSSLSEAFTNMFK